MHDFPEVHEYPVATATHKTVEVYEAGGAFFVRSFSEICID